MFRTIVLPILTGLILLSGSSARSHSPQTPHPAVPVQQENRSAPGHREMIVPEPVFQGSVYVIEAGMENETSVILVHGAGDRGARDWEKTIPFLSQHYHVFAFDLPGFGRSSKKNVLYSPSRYAAFIDWFANKYAKKPFVLIGHSLGGALALRYAGGHPDALQRLILVDAAGILNHVSLAKEMYDMNTEESLAGADAFAKFVRSMLDRFGSEERMQRIKEGLRTAPLRKVILGGDPEKIASLAMVLEDYGSAVEKIRTPALLIWGEKDQVAPIRTAKALKAVLPASCLVLIPETGHVPMLEQPDIFNRTVMEGLAGTTQKPAESDAEQSGPDTDRVARYEHRSGLLLTGQYKSIELNHCSDVTIANATVGRLVVSGSNIVIENSRISGADVALAATKSVIIATDAVFEADTAIRASRCRLDLAGVTLTGRSAAVTTGDSVSLFFSISRSDSPHYSGPLHGSRKVTPDRPL